MPKATLTLADLAAVEALITRKHAPDEPYKAVGDLAQRVLGHRLFTVMRHRAESAEVSAAPSTYPPVPAMIKS